MKKLKRAIIEWWNGTAEYNRRERSGEFDHDGAKPIPYEKYTFSAKVAHWAVKEYKWIIGATILIVGLLIQWYIYTHPNHPPTISYGDEGRRTEQPMPGNNGLRSKGSTRE